MNKINIKNPLIIFTSSLKTEGVNLIVEAEEVEVIEHPSNDVVLKEMTFFQTSAWSSYPIKRQYEEGMTWEEFINSDYNVIQNDECYDYYIRGQFINQDGYVKFYGTATDYTDYITLDVYAGAYLVEIADVMSTGYGSSGSTHGGGSN